MKRKFTFLIASAVMLLTMMATTGEMWGQTRTSYADTLIISTYASAHNWTSGTAYTPLNTAHITISGVTGGNNNKYYSSNQSWRHYEGDSGAVTVAIATADTANYNLSSVKITYANGNNGILKDGSTTVSSGSAYSISGKSKTFTVGHSSGNKNGNVQITSIVISYESAGGGNTPSITASNVDIVYNATQGSIGYTLNNATGNVEATVTTGDWLTLGEITSSAVPFTCSANTSTTSTRTATVTLSFEGAQDKVVTVTQGKAPITIAAAREQGTESVVTRGVVTSCVGTTGYIQDNTAAICVYGTSLTIGDDIVVSGTLSDYNGLLEITSPQVTVLSSGNTVTPTVKTIAEINSDYEGDNELQGWLVKIENATVTAISGSGNSQNTTIAQSTNTIVVRGNPGVTLEVNDVLSSLVGNIGCYNAAQIANPRDVVVEPEITATPSPFTAPSYVFGTAEPTYNVLTVNGSNLTANISLVLNENSNFEMSTDLNSWTSSLTLTQSEGSVTDEEVAIRMKAGLAKGAHAGTVTLTSTGATNVVVNLSGTVTGAAYTIEQYSLPATAHGTITFAPTSPIEEGTEVTLTATPADGYDFTADSWVFYNASTLEQVSLTVTDGNKITMPAYNLAVDGTFAPKPTYAITKVVTPDNSGTIETDNTAWEGKTVTVLVEAANGYSFSSIVISKTGDPETTISTTGNAASGFTFTMPDYAVTATANFVSNTYEGSFVQHSGNLTEGDYILVYNNQAMNDTINNSKYKVTDVAAVENIISDPSRAIVWHIAPSKITGYWTICSVATNKYVSGTASSTNVAAVSDTTNNSTTTYWTVTGTYDFRCKANEGQNTARYLHNYNGVFGNYASDNGGALTLYKYTELTERTITFHGNGGTIPSTSAPTYTQQVYDGIATNLTANQFTLANSAFVGWSTTQNGEVEYADGASITVTENDLDLYAKWETSYTAMVDDQIVGGTVLINDEEIVEVAAGTEMTLTYTANQGYAFSAWNVYKADEPTTTVSVENNTFSMPAYDVIVSATFVEVTTYSLVTNVNQIVSGKHYIIASGAANGTAYAMGYQKDSNRNGVAVTVYNGQIAETENVYEFVINTHLNNDEVDYYTIYDTVTPGYLYASSNSANQLKTTTTLNDNGKWTIEISDNIATITAQGTNSRKLMRYNPNNNSPIFACYATNTTIGNNPCLYVKDNDEDYEYYGMVITYTGTSIPDGETLTVGTGSVMTITNNSFTNNEPANLIIKDGAQLILPTSSAKASVYATVEKNIAAASAWGSGNTANNWYTISSPLVGNQSAADINGLITNGAASDYDLYIYDEENKYWRNYKQYSFAIKPGRGYLYASESGTMISFAGVINDAEVATNVTKEANGLNLIGNPFTQNITMANITNATLSGGYVLQKAGNWKSDVDLTVAPCQGFLVQIPDGTSSLTISRTPSSKSRANRDYIEFTVANSEYEDVTYALFDNTIGLNKISHRNAEIPMVYIPQNGQDYAIATMSDETQAFNLNFKAMTTGQYTLRLKTKGNYSYLHVIDRLTGEDIDMLLEGEYSFIGSPRDNENRFIVKLNYNATIDEVETGDSFVYQNGDELVVNGKGTLQVYDVMGRFVESYEVNGNKRISASQFANSVYIFRMVGETVMTQKIVVR